MSTSRSAPGISGFWRGVGSSSSTSSSSASASAAGCSSAAAAGASAGCSSGTAGASATGSSAAGSCSSEGSLPCVLSSDIRVMLLAGLELERRGLLGGVRVLGTRVDLQLGQLLPREAVLRQHALHGEADDLLGAALEHVVERARLQAARVARVAVVHLRLALLTRDRDLLGVDDDHEVARVHVRRVGGLALAAQGVRDLGGEAPEGLALGVDEQPVALAVE